MAAEAAALLHGWVGLIFSTYNSAAGTEGGGVCFDLPTGYCVVYVILCFLCLVYTKKVQGIAKGPRAVLTYSTLEAKLLYCIIRAKKVFLGPSGALVVGGAVLF